VIRETHMYYDVPHPHNEVTFYQGIPNHMRMIGKVIASKNDQDSEVLLQPAASV
jgi:glutamate mutase epsilon subunit